MYVSEDHQVSAVVLSELFRRWLMRDTEGIVTGIAVLSRDDADVLLGELRVFTRLVEDAKEVL